MLEIIFDTETTGFDPFSGDRIVEIGCVEVENYLPTGRTFHKYINPERDVPHAAAQIHGLTTERLQGEPVFAEIIADFRDFVGDLVLIAHNAEFDMKFINWEMEKLGFSAYAPTQSLDTLAIARRKFPGSPNSLDALCKRFSIDNSNRVKHGALLDAELLAEVYLELMGGRQRGLSLEVEQSTVKISAAETRLETKGMRSPRPHAPSAEELERHTEFVSKLSDPVWLEK